ncbi:hypothetical protein AMS64_16610 [Aeromonas veronii]|nr:hypothetical protein AMS64_16610 [Aeromonas veronii]POG17115.1 hypothetical protein C2849_21185 [Aeromonas veronii]
MFGNIGCLFRITLLPNPHINLMLASKIGKLHSNSRLRRRRETIKYVRIKVILLHVFAHMTKDYIVLFRLAQSKA